MNINSSFFVITFVFLLSLMTLGGCSTSSKNMFKKGELPIAGIIRSGDNKIKKV